MSFKASSDCDHHIGVFGGENNVFDIKDNQKYDWIQLEDSYNTTINCDETDRFESHFYVGGTKHMTHHWRDGRSSEKYTKFVTKDKSDFANIIKRENVPSCLLKTYDSIANKNENTYIDTQDEFDEFSNKVKQAYFVEKQIDKKDVNKMGYDVASFHNKNYVEEYTVLGFQIGKALALGIPFISSLTGFLGMFVGTISSLVPTAYDYITGNNFTQELSHWTSARHSIDTDPQTPEEFKSNYKETN